MHSLTHTHGAYAKTRLGGIVRGDLKGNDTKERDEMDCGLYSLQCALLLGQSETFLVQINCQLMLTLGDLFNWWNLKPNKWFIAVILWNLF